MDAVLFFFFFLFFSVKFTIDVCVNELQRERKRERERERERETGRRKKEDFLGKWKLNYRSFHTSINGNINPHTHIRSHKAHVKCLKSPSRRTQQVLSTPTRKLMTS